MIHPSDGPRELHPFHRWRRCRLLPGQYRFLPRDEGMTLKTDLIILAAGTAAAIIAPTLVLAVDAYWRGLIP